MLIQFISRLHEADKDIGDASGEADGKVKASDILNRYGKNEEAALRLAELYAEAQNEMWRVRERNRTLKQERDELKAKQPADGMVVIAKEDAALLENYRALGAPAEVKKAIDANGTATAELASLKREKALARAADVAGFKVTVLTTLAGDLDIQIKDKDGKPHAVVVKDGTETPLADYATSAWADFLPALKQQPAAGAPDINAGARGNGNTPLITDDERRRADAHYRHTF